MSAVAHPTLQAANTAATLQRHPVKLAGRIPPIAAGEVQVWRLHIAEFQPWLGQLGQLLSLPERVRAQRFKSVDLQQQFVITRAILRILLSAYTGTAAQKISLYSAPGGKLRMRSAREVHFNISHAGNVAIIGFAGDREIGVDLELDPPENAERLAGYLLPQHEVQLVRQMPSSLARSRFGTMWTRMEACAKATGSGVASTIAQRHHDRFVSAPWCSAAGSHIDVDAPTVRSFRLGLGMVCSVAAFGANWNLKPMRLMPSGEVTASGARRPLICRFTADQSFERI
jgi:4'-phosphopantetheinyl transferase